MGIYFNTKHFSQWFKNLRLSTISTPASRTTNWSLLTSPLNGAHHQRIKPDFHALPNDAQFADITFVQVDVDENAEAAGQAGISCMPTFQYYKDGVKVDELQGANLDTLKAKALALKQ